MPFKDPMTQETLRVIQDRNRGNSDVKALLWEIKRLRSIVMRADQLQRMLLPDKLDPTTSMIYDLLRDELEDEPCVIEKMERIYGEALGDAGNVPRQDKRKR